MSFLTNELIFGLERLQANEGLNEVVSYLVLNSKKPGTKTGFLFLRKNAYFNLASSCLTILALNGI